LNAIERAAPAYGEADVAAATSNARDQGRQRERTPAGALATRRTSAMGGWLC